jgi:hypothetical protein
MRPPKAIACILIVSNLNAGLVFLTAGHGFLFIETPPAETAKSKLEEKTTSTASTCIMQDDDVVTVHEPG